MLVAGACRPSPCWVPSTCDLCHLSKNQQPHTSPGPFRDRDKQAHVPFTASSTGSPTKAAKSSATMDVYACETRAKARRRVASAVGAGVADSDHGADVSNSN